MNTIANNSPISKAIKVLYFDPLPDSMNPHGTESVIGKIAEEISRIEIKEEGVARKYSRTVDNPLNRASIHIHAYITYQATIVYDSKMTDKGSFKSMHRGVWIGSDGSEKEVAVLSIKKPDSSVDNEIYRLQQYKGQKTVPELFDHFWEDAFPPSNAYILIEELCKGGDLAKWIKEINEKEPINEPRAAFITYQILRIVYIFHNSGLVIRDIKPANFLLTNAAQCNIRITDLSAICVREALGPKDVKFAGTPTFFSPETWKQLHAKKQSSNDFPADLWSVGQIIALLIKNQFLIKYFTPDIEPGEKLKEEQLSRFTLSLTNPPVCKPGESQLAHLSAKLLNPNPALRPTAIEALQHPTLLPSLIASVHLLDALQRKDLEIDDLFKLILGLDLDQIVELERSNKEALLNESFPRHQLLSPKRESVVSFVPSPTPTPRNPSITPLSLTGPERSIYSSRGKYTVTPGLTEEATPFQVGPSPSAIFTSPTKFVDSDSDDPSSIDEVPLNRRGSALPHPLPGSFDGKDSRIQRMPNIRTQK